jgi:hypothetical protein
MIQTLEATLTQIVDDGRSTPGAKQQNDGAKRWKQLCWLKDSGSKK